MYKWKSRKWWAAIITAAVMMANATFDLGIDTEQAVAVIVPIVAFIIGESAIDATRAANSK